MREQRNIGATLDWPTMLLYFLMVLLGWLNIYAAVYDAELHQSIFDVSQNSGKQLIWIFSAFFLIVVILVIDFRFYDSFALLIYGGVLLLLVAVLIFGKEIAGSRSWFDFGFLRLQPSEFAKFTTVLALAKIIDASPKKINTLPALGTTLAIIGIPAGLIVLQGDAGSALVFSAFVFVLYREGMPSFILVGGLLLVFLFVTTLFIRDSYLWHFAIGISLVGVAIAIIITKTLRARIFTLLSTILAVGFIFSINFAISSILKPHQQKRIEILINPESDLDGAGWQVNQSKIAIGSGGIRGKGFLNGTQTKFDFVPDQSTDFIFCTVGEEHGWLGSLGITILFAVLIFRLIQLAERQKSRFARVYGYGVASIFFFHFAVNIGMTVGLFPVIGIPLPFFSYGGSSLWAFTILLFIFLKLDAHRMQILGR